MTTQDDLQRALKKQSRDLAGPGPMEQHILLLKLVSAIENAPNFGPQPQLGATSTPRKWLAQVGAILSKLSSSKGTDFKVAMIHVSSHWSYTIEKIQGQVLDAIEELKLELELDGRADIGSTYEPGDVYKFFADLKEIISGVQREIFIVDPYFDGTAFDQYLSTLPQNVQVRILADRYSKDLQKYIAKHSEQFGSTTQLFKTDRIHDRVIFLDRSDCWIVGASVKDAGKKATYLIPLNPNLVAEKLRIYEEILSGSKKIAGNDGDGGT